MMDIFLNITSSLFLLIGSFLCLSGGIGILRFPDFFTRMHAVGVSDTLASAMILIGLMLQVPDAIVIVKLVMILLMTLLISPTASHALAKAAIHNGITHKIGKTGESDKELSSNP